jgi:hypothetical protein
VYGTFKPAGIWDYSAQSLQQNSSTICRLFKQPDLTTHRGCVPRRSAGDASASILKDFTQEQSAGDVIQSTFYWLKQPQQANWQLASAASGSYKISMASIVGTNELWTVIRYLPEEDEENQEIPTPVWIVSVPVNVKSRHFLHTDQKIYRLGRRN